jgi:hypothetical protein
MEPLGKWDSQDEGKLQGSAVSSTLPQTSPMSNPMHGFTRLSSPTGVERFRVLKVKEEMPVMICEVEVLAEDDETNPEVNPGS